MSRFGLALLLLAGCAPARTATVPPERIERFLSWGVTTVGYGVDPLTEEQAEGRWHWRLTVRGTEVVLAVEIGPTGQPRKRRELQREAGKLVVREFDGYGVPTGVRTVDADGLEQYVAHGGQVGEEGCLKRRLVGDAAHRLVEYACLDAEGAPMVNESGCELVRFFRNPRGGKVRVECHDADGSKATFADGFHASATEFDALGYAQQIVYLGLDGKPKSFGCARATFEYAKTGPRTRMRCVSASGAFEYENRWTHDARGCEISSAAYQSDGHLRSNEGVAFTRYGRDLHCTQTSVEKYDVNGDLTGQPATRRFELDPRGRTATERCGGADKKPTSCSALATEVDGALVRYTYDALDRLTEWRCYLPDGKPSGCGNDYPHRQRVSYDSQGFSVTKEFFDTSDHPVVVLGASRIVAERDKAGVLLGESFFGTHGEKVVATVGCHSVRSVRGPKGHLKAMECRGTEGEFLPGHVCKGAVCFLDGAARVIVERESESRVFNVHLDVDGAELGRVDCEKAPCFK